MGISQFQHYLPEVYLRGYATTAGQVWRYDRLDQTLKLLPPRVIGAEKDLYSILAGDEISQEIEDRWFNPLDGRFGPILRKLENGKEISQREMIHLANFVAYLRVRTPAFIRETELRIRQFETQVGVARDAIEYKSGPPDHGRDLYVTSEEKSDKVSPRRGNDGARSEALQILIKSGLHLAQTLADLDWTLLVAPRTRSFVVGDNPFVIVPPRSHQTDLDGVGPLVPGAATFVPLSANVCLRILNTRTLTSSRNVDGRTVRFMNACQVLTSERFLFGSSDALLTRLAVDHIDGPGLNPTEVVIREAPSASDGSRSLIHSFTKSKIPPEWADRVPWN